MFTVTNDNYENCRDNCNYNQNRNNYLHETENSGHDHDPDDDTELAERMHLAIQKDELQIFGDEDESNEILLAVFL